MVSDFFLQLLLILFFARLLGETVARFGIPSVIGELLAGILLGPSLLDWINTNEILTVLADVGIILLLFEVGLESDISKLVKAGISAFSSASIGVAVPFILGFSVSHYIFHLEMLPSLFIGGALTATSIGITLRVLTDLNRQASREAQIILGAAIIDDIIGVVLLAILKEFASSGEINVYQGEKVLLFIVIFLLIAPILAKIITSVIKYYDDISEIPGLLPTSIVALLMLFAWLAEEVGAPSLLGGFAAGLALSGSSNLQLPSFFNIPKEFSKRVHEQMKPIIHLFTPIFFVNIGLSINLFEINWSSPFLWFVTASILAAALIGKLCAGLVLVNENRFVRWIVGIAMMPRGEVGLIFAGLGKESGVLDNEIYTSLIVIIALTTIIAPVILRWSYDRTARDSQQPGESQKR